MPIETKEVEASEEAAVSLPTVLLAGKTVSPGDVVRIQVVTAPDEAGEWTGRYAEESEAPTERDTTMDEMTSRFKPQKKEMV